MQPVDSPLKWHGGKSYLASRILALMPPRQSKDYPEGWLHYVEPYAGGLSVLLAQNPEGISEVVNDRNMDLSNFWCVLQNRPLFQEFQRILAVTPFSEVEYDSAHDILCGQKPDILFTLATGIDDQRAAASVARAVAFFCYCRMSLAGRMKAFAPLSRTRTRRGMNEQASAWLNAIEGLPAVHERLQRVVILNRDAIDVITQQDGSHTLIYADPPYMHQTRASTGEYQHEMTHQQHDALLCTLAGIQGRFLLSGYRSTLYDERAELHGWKRHDFDLPNNSAGGATKRRMMESVWVNF